MSQRPTSEQPSRTLAARPGHHVTAAASHHELRPHCCPGDPSANYHAALSLLVRATTCPQRPPTTNCGHIAALATRQPTTTPHSRCSAGPPRARSGLPPRIAIARLPWRDVG